MKANEYQASSEARTNVISPSGQHRPWHWLIQAAFAGAIPGSLFGLYYAVAGHIMSGLALDGAPPGVTTTQLFLLYTCVIGLGAVLGAAAVSAMVVVMASVVGFFLAIWKLLKRLCFP